MSTTASAPHEYMYGHVVPYDTYMTIEQPLKVLAQLAGHTPPLTVDGIVPLNVYANPNDIDWLSRWAR